MTMQQQRISPNRTSGHKGILVTSDSQGNVTITTPANPEVIYPPEEAMELFLILGDLVKWPDDDL